MTKETGDRGTGKNGPTCSVSVTLPTRYAALALHSLRDNRGLCTGASQNVTCENGCYDGENTLFQL